MKVIFILLATCVLITSQNVIIGDEWNTKADDWEIIDYNYVIPVRNNDLDRYYILASIPFLIPYVITIIGAFGAGLTGVVEQFGNGMNGMMGGDDIPPPS